MKKRVRHLLSFLLICFFAFFTQNAQSQIFINEISSDPANNDGSPINQTGEFIELYNAGAAIIPIGGWILADNDAALRFPSGAIINPGEFLVISSYGLDAVPAGTSGTGISCQTCDFNGLVLNYNWGINAPNIQRVGGNIIGNSCVSPAPSNPSGSNPDCSNTGNRDENWLLLDNTGNIVDAIYYGMEMNACVSVLKTFNLPAYGLLPAVTVSVPLAPFDATEPIADVTGATGTTNTNSVTWKYIGPQINGCNTSYQRMADGGTWANGAINNATYPFGTQPSTQPTNHPTPGKANASIPFTFSVNNAGTPVTQTIDGEMVDVYSLCAPAAVDFIYTVNNYQNVQRTTTYATTKVGSFVRVNGGTALPWASITPVVAAPSGTTTLTYTDNPSVGITDYELVWEDYVLNCCGATSLNSPKNKSSCAWECYERKKVRVILTETMMSSKTTISCPEDFTEGTVNIASLITGGANLTYQLFDNAVSVQTNTNGVFSLSNTLGTPLTVTVTDGSSCTLPITITINDNCKAAPICPKLVIDTATTTKAGNKCPDDVISLCIDTDSSKNLPNGGVVDWYKGATSTFNPYLSPVTDFIASSNIVYTGGLKAPGGSGLGDTCSYLSGILVDACNGTGIEADNEFVVLQTGSKAVTVDSLAVGFPGSTADITKALTTDFTNEFTGAILVASLQPLTCNTLLQVVTNGGSIPANSTVILFPSSRLTSSYDFSSFCGLGTVYILIHNSVPASGTYANYNSLTATNGRQTYVDFGEGCGGHSYTYSRAVTGWTTNSDGDYISFAGVDTVTQASTGGTVAIALDAKPNSANSWQNNGCATPNFITPPTIACVDYTIPFSDCSTTGNTFYFKAVVKPQPVLACVAPNDGITTTAAGAYTVTCPTAVLSGSGLICNGSPVGSATIQLTSSVSLDGGTAVINVNGTATNFTLTGVSPYSLIVSTVGSYELVSITPPVGICAATVSGSAEIKEKNPPLTVIQGGCSGPSMDQPTILVFPSDAVNDSPVEFCLLSTTPAMLGLPICNATGLFTLPASTTDATVSMSTGSGLSACTTQVLKTISTCSILPILPVTLLTFNGIANKETSLLNWKTVQEINNSHFEIQSSIDGNNFIAIGITTAVGNTNSNYSFIDDAPAKGINYYRLKIVDVSGRFTYSAVVKVFFKTDYFTIASVYPNPANNTIKVEMYSPKQLVTDISIVDVTGRLMYKAPVKIAAEQIVTKSINVSTFATGPYYIKIYDSNKKINTIAFIKK